MRYLHPEDEKDATDKDLRLSMLMTLYINLSAALYEAFPFYTGKVGFVGCVWFIGAHSYYFVQEGPNFSAW